MDEYCVLTTKVTAYNDIRLLIGAPWYAKAVQPSRTIPLMNFYLLSERPLLAGFCLSVPSVSGGAFS